MKDWIDLKNIIEVLIEAKSISENRIKLHIVVKIKTVFCFKCLKVRNIIQK